MSQQPSSPRFTPPRAPSQEKWDAMSPDERRRAVDALPGEVTDAEMSPPEGDLHFQAKVDTLETLQEHYRRLKRRVYLAAELPVYYPDERRFAPDLLAVFDVEDKVRSKYVVTAEGKGLDVVFEIHVGGDRKKDAVVNVERYGRLGISEYFIYDRAAQKVLGYRLPADGARKYVPILPQQRRLMSERLGLELAVEDGRLRFFLGNAVLYERAELIMRLEREMVALESKADDEARQLEDARRLLEEETKRREDAERRVAELEAELKKRR